MVGTARDLSLRAARGNLAYGRTAIALSAVLALVGAAVSLASVSWLHDRSNRKLPFAT
jgi:hypothetical protein